MEGYRPSDERDPRTQQGPRPGQGHPSQRGQQGYPPQHRQSQPPPMSAHGDPRYQDPRYQDPSYPYSQGRPPQRPRQRSGTGSVVVYSVLGLIAMAAGAAAFAVVALPANFVRDRVITAVKEKTGRDLVIAGSSSFTLFPALGVTLADVSLSGAPGQDAKPLVAMKSLDVSVAFWPLIKREVQISTLFLRDPVFNLEVDGNGRRSWDFAAEDERANRVRFAQADAPVTDAGASSDERRSRVRLSGLKLEDVRIDNGTLNYRDQRTGKTSEFSAINVQLALAALEEPLQAQGSLAWKGKTVSFTSALTSLADVIESRPAKVKVSFGADVLDAAFEGSARLADGVSAEGILSAKSASARDLAAWFGTDLPPSEGFGALTAKGLLRSVPDQLTLSTADITLDQTTARGDIGLDTRDARPLVTANLKLTELDLNTYASHGEKTVKRSAPPAASRDKSSGKAQSIEDLLQDTAPPSQQVPGPRVKGYTKRHGWSDEPFNLDMLGIVDANAKLSIGKLTVRDIHLDQSDVTVALKNRVMKTTLDQVRLYEGTGKGTITLDGSSGTSASLGANLSLDGISAKPLLTDAADIDRVTGKGRVALALAGQGASERQIVETLNGKFEAAFADGAITGINVAGMMRNLSKGNLGGLDAAPTDKTDFSEMTSTWAVKSGIAENDDLKLVSPLLRVSGSGRVELPAREVDYMLR
ncbi:MAG TPA: AsmA family protein, partial [Hyphomicrobium sp.]|nr:AsmA family protein [Hyphomicrobium sp.]